MPNHMRLADFIRAEMERILQAWEDFASGLLPTKDMDESGLRDHAKEMLIEIADDLESYQSDADQAAKSKGDAANEGNDSPADVHGGERFASGFTVMEAISEFRALRASVVSLWAIAGQAITPAQLGDLTRFHESVDQAVAESLEQFAMENEEKTRLFRAVLFASSDPIFVFDLEGRIVYANKATSELFALEPAAILGKTVLDLGFWFASEFDHNLKKVIADRTTFRGTFVHSFSSGFGDRFDYVLSPVVDEHQRTETTVCILRDITEQARHEREIWHAAHHDHLTGLPNRRYFLDRLDQEIKQARRSGLPFFVLYIDLDGFKAVNDSFGHEAGDVVLIEVAERLVDCVREQDSVARHGGDEFTVIVVGATHGSDAELVAQKIRDALERPFQVAERAVRISASIGVASYPHDGASSGALVDAADRAMYVVKNEGSDD